MFKKTKLKEVKVSKFLDDLPGMEDVIREPRSYSPDRLKDACNNIKFDPNQDFDPIENITCQFVFRNLFYIMHQTGLYNPQRRLFNHIASVERVVIREYKKLNKLQKEKGKISDLYFYDLHGKYILLRLEHPNSDLNYAALPKLFNDANNSRCLAAVYVSNQMPSAKDIELIRTKTNYQSDSEKYLSLINENTSFNLLSYEASPNAVIYKLLHPDLAKDESAKAAVAAELIKSFYSNTSALLT